MDSFVDKAISLLDSNRILDSIKFIRARLVADRNSDGIDIIDRLGETYGYMLDYMAKGLADSGRMKLYSDIREQLYSIVRKIEEDEKTRESGSLFYTCLRNIRFSSVSFDDALSRFLDADSTLQLIDDESDGFKKIVGEKDRALKDIFNIVWTLPIGERDTLRRVSAVAIDNTMDFTLRALIVSAMTMNLLMVYDRQKLMSIVEIECKTDSDRLRARAVIGMLLVMNRYSERLGSDYEMDLRFRTWTDDSDNFAKVREAIFALVRARGGKNLLKKIENEIIPDLMKFGPKIMDSINGLKDEEGKISIDSIEGNPEWEKMMQSGSLGKKLRRFARMQEDGGDISLTMFSRLAGNFFFNDIDVWFRPFSEKDILTMGISPGLRNVFSILGKTSSLCDLDKFAMAINLQRLPANARDMMTSSLDAQSEQMDEEMKEIMLHTVRPEFDIEVYNYARVLYRFFNYFRLKNEFLSPFDEALDITSIPYLQDFLNNEEILQSVSEYYLRQGFYADAINSYGLLARRDPLSAHLYVQKQGYCYEKSGDISNAFGCYMRAAEIDSNDQWLAKKIYLTGIKSGNFKEASDALVRLLDVDSDNLEYLTDLAEIQLIHSEAIKTGKYSVSSILLKCDYLSPDNQNVMRIKVKYCIKTGKYSEAIQTLSPLISDISMYLAAKSLGNDSKTDYTDAAEDETRMADDLSDYITLLALNQDEKSLISAISQLLMLDKAGMTPLKTLVKLRERWQLESGLGDMLQFLPLYVDAAVKSL